MSRAEGDAESQPVLLVTGGSSFLGRRLVIEAVSRWTVLATFWQNPSAVPATLPAERRFQLDLRDEDAVARLCAQQRPQVIIYAAGSERPADHVRLIIDGTRHVAASAARLGARLINLSTDVVFDGRHAPCREQDSPAPLHAYGRAKAEAEAIVGASGANAVTVRTSLIYSLTGEDHCVDWLWAPNPGGEPATLFVDEYRSPIWVNSLAAACLELAEHAFRGTLHVAGAQSVSRWHLGSRPFAVLGVAPEGRIRPRPTPEGLRERRPQDCTLDISLAHRVLKTPLPGVDEVCPPRIRSANGEALRASGHHNHSVRSVPCSGRRC